MLEELGCVFHHIGVACKDFALEQQVWEQLGYRQEGPEFEDLNQRVRGRFLVGPGPRLELLVPTSADSPVRGVLQRRTRMYHQAFTVAHFDRALLALEDAGARRVGEPACAVAFAGRRIVFLFLRNGHLLELVETAPALQAG